MILELNLQFFAKDGPGGEKTEQPTSKKLSDARKEGQVAKSREIANCLGLLAFFLVLKVLIGYIGNSFLAIFSEIYNKIPESVTMYQGNVNEYDFIQVKEGISVGEDIFNRGLCLPSDIKMTAEDQAEVIQIVKELF